MENSEQQVYGNSQQNWPLTYSYAALTKVAQNEETNRMCCSPYSQSSVGSDQSDNGLQFSGTTTAIVVNGVNIHDYETNCVDSLKI